MSIQAHAHARLKRPPTLRPMTTLSWLAIVLASLASQARAVTVTPEDFGAAGSTIGNSCTVNSGANANTLTCADIKDFRVGQGVMVKEAGPLPHGGAYPVSPAPQVRQVGTGTGSNRYCYIVAVGDPMHGLQAPSQPTCLDNQPLVDIRNPHQFWLAEPFHTSLDKSGLPHVAAPHIVPLYLWYMSFNNGPYQLMTLTIEQDPRASYVNAGASRPNGSFGGWPLTLPGVLNSQGVLRNNSLFAKITAISSGPQGHTVTLDRPAARAMQTASVNHDDTDGVQRAIDAVAAQGGGTVRFDAKAYSLQRPSFSTFNEAAPYTTDHLYGPWIAYWRYAHILHLNTANPSNLRLEGTTDANGGQTLITTGPSSGIGAFLYMSTPQMEKQGGPGYVANANHGIQPVDKGNFTVQLANPSSAAALHAGDDIWLYSGNFFNAPPNHPDFKPCVTNSSGMAGGCHYSELNTISAIDPQSGTVTLERPTSKKYWDDGHDSFGFVKVNKLPRNVSIANLQFLTAHQLIDTGAVGFDIAIDGINSLRVVPGALLGTGYKRGFSVTNSTWHMGAGSNGWSGTDEFDQITDVVFRGNTIMGYAAEGAEGPSTGARLYFTEGTSNLDFTHNVLSGVQLIVQEGDEIRVRDNSFYNAVPWIGGTQRGPFRATLDDWAYVSFASQHKADITGNNITLTSAYQPVFIMSLGNYDDGRIEHNTITSASARPDLFMISAASGTVADNTLNNQSAATTRQAFIQIGTDVDAKPVTVRNNTLSGRQPFAVSVYKPFSPTASICVLGNSVNGSPADTVQTTDQPHYWQTTVPYFVGYNFQASCAP